MTIATIGTANDGTQVIAVETSEQASLSTMVAFSELGYTNLRRMNTTDEVFIAYSDGRELATDIDDDGRTIVVAV